MTFAETPSTLGRRRVLKIMAIFAVCGAGLILASEPLLAESEEYRTIGLEIRDRALTRAENTIRITEGETVQFEWTTDEIVELHLHGYDIHTVAEPGGIVSMTFQAHTAGRFPVTAHNFNHGTIIYLEIYPR